MFTWLMVAWIANYTCEFSFAILQTVIPWEYLILLYDSYKLIELQKAS